MINLTLKVSVERKLKDYNEIIADCIEKDEFVRSVIKDFPPKEEYMRKKVIIDFPYNRKPFEDMYITYKIGRLYFARKK